ncbi:hypothetical protein [Streptomyces sp. NPDC058308]|uniref:hypothetical protein n=1 Tax=Streptomyces sp. NPDC058308 TaxID=3346440 RepID=UPI0036EF93F8
MDRSAATTRPPTRSGDPARRTLRQRAGRVLWTNRARASTRMAGPSAPPPEARRARADALTRTLVDRLWESYSTWRVRPGSPSTWSRSRWSYCTTYVTHMTYTTHTLHTTHVTRGAGSLKERCGHE